MKKLLRLVYTFAVLLLAASCNTAARDATDNLLAEGRQPQISVTAEGTTRVVYGQGDAIYCVTSQDNGNSFSDPVIVGKIKDLLLGMAMGPQIASTPSHSVVTAIDKKGNIHSFTLAHSANSWAKTGQVNDVPGVAAEGLMSIASNGEDTFYAVWLDVRSDKKNKVVLTSAKAPVTTWGANKVVYQSPDSTVCECCKPNIAVKEKKVHIMFRNWLNGSRDFYLSSSTDGGQTFAAPVKLGQGTWKVDGCPMDGGGLLIDKNNTVQTTWQRDGSIYVTSPGSSEKAIGKGRNCRISNPASPVVAWKDGDNLKVKFIASGKEQTIGKGTYIETATLPDKKTLCIWENDKKLYFTKL
ncbi:hypothetical protein WG947_01155 [Pontibacter sp. H259]|uniref:hypothetical protein n=1 Tax=Pontibacter sp. H259 TaxID=3133421 RepID=UPI0030BA7EDB